MKKVSNDFKKRESIWKIIIYTLALILTVTYIVYRIFFTLPIHNSWLHIVIAIIVLGLEVFEAIDFTIYYFNVLCYSKKSLSTPKIKKTQYPDVDVFIATINESKELLEDTIKACINMKYPNKDKVHIYVCDDGNRKEIKSLAKKYKVGYITRKDNEGAKAGNYNNALANSNSPYIATFDADMKPTTDFLLKTIPFFVAYESIGFVQLPQSFNNPDIFQLRFGLTDKIPFEQDYFYHVIQSAKNSTNSTIYCGTNAVLSREALDKTNGFALNTITEDIATGMLIESKGYQGVAISDIEAYGTAVDDLSRYVKQRSRWGRGCIQILKNYKILFNKELSVRQKMDYMSSISYWFFGVKRMLYLIIPLLFSLFGFVIIEGNIMLFMGLFFPTYLIKRFALDLLDNKKRSSTWNKIYELSIAPIMAKEVLKELFGFGSTKFEVTSKDKTTYKMTKTNRDLLLVHIVFLLFSILGVVLSIYKATMVGIWMYILPLIWLSVNIIYLFIVILFDLRVRPIYYDKFIPNNTKRYGIKSFIGIFTSIFKKKFKKE